MKTTSILMVMLLPLLAKAKPAGYDWSVGYVTENSPTNSAKRASPVYVASVAGDSPVFADIIAYTNNLSLRQVIDNTRYKGSDVDVKILRSKRQTVPVFHDIVKSAELPDFKLRIGDVIWLSIPGIPEK